MYEMALRNIVGYAHAHFFDRKHYKHWGRDLAGIVTDDQYLEVAKQVGTLAARRVPGSHVARRGNNDLIVYLSTPFTRKYSNNGDGGVFMIVMQRGARGLLVTLFAPNSGVAYFYREDQRRLI